MPERLTTIVKSKIQKDGQMNICKILLTRSMLPVDLDYIRMGLDRTVAGQYELIVPTQFDEQTLCTLAADIDVLLGPFVTEKLLDSAKNLKLIQVPWTGMDTFNFDVVKNRNVPVCNTHSNADAVAELALALTLDLTKKIAYHDRKMRKGNWNRDQQPLNLKSVMIKGKTVCVLGLGNIGSRIAALFSAFGATVVGTSNRKTAGGMAVARVYPQDEIIDAAKTADILICALPLTQETRGCINTSFLDALKPGAVLVNVSRAAVIDEDALFCALQTEKISGFAADVWWSAPKRGESESWPSTHNPFQNLENVVLSPHRAGFVDGSLPHLDGAIENISALIQNKPLSNIVDCQKAY